MKLSKAQQEVVDKMREGWECHHPYYLKRGDEKHWISIATTRVLDRLGIIERKPGFLTIYQLTEKYRSNEIDQSPAHDS
jgi:hypothetical protein